MENLRKKPMTVAQLIKSLQKFQPETPVMVICCLPSGGQAYADWSEAKLHKIRLNQSGVYHTFDFGGPSDVEEVVEAVVVS